MILLRFKKVAIKKNLSYSIVVSPLQIAPTSNKFVEKVGFYKPIIDR
jgi:ribosomal protein S16